MPHHCADLLDVWSVEGRFRHLIYSPKGAIEGVLIETEGLSAQFVTDVHDPVIALLCAGLREGQSLVVEGTEASPSAKGEAAHIVYRLERLVSIDGRKPRPARPQDQGVTGTVVRFNYAKHGAANGVVLDYGDFIHARPEGMERLDLKVGDKINAKGAAQWLITGKGRVIEAHRVNGTRIRD